MDSDLVLSLETLHRDAYGWARHCCGTLADPSDVLQIAYLKVMQGKARPGKQGALKTWWFGVIRLTAKEEQRRRRFRDSLPGRLLRFGPARENNTSESAFEADETARDLKTALSQLSGRQAEALHLVFYQELSIAEAAQVMGVSLGSARTHYERGKTRLRELLASSHES